MSLGAQRKSEYNPRPLTKVTYCRWRNQESITLVEKVVSVIDAIFRQSAKSKRCTMVRFFWFKKEIPS
jgi:hypothetical protein